MQTEDQLHELRQANPNFIPQGHTLHEFLAGNECLIK
jgi:hypothetical protein